MAFELQPNHNYVKITIINLEYCFSWCSLQVSYSEEDSYVLMQA